MTVSAPRARHATKYYGKHSGTVTDNQDSQHLGRLQVQVPSVLGTQISVWARPCLPYGHFFVPPIGTRVWVEFEGGDPSYPIWVGTWYAQGDVPPDADVSPPDVRMIHTKSGHAVELEDTAGEEKVLVRHKLDSFVSIDKKGSVIVANKNGSNVYLNADGSEASFVSEHGHLMSMTSHGILLATKDGAMIELKGNKINITASGGVQVLGGNVSISGTGILLGGQTAQFSPMVAEKFLTLFSTHIHPSAMGPTGPPTPPIPPGPPGAQATASTSVKVGT